MASDTTLPIPQKRNKYRNPKPSNSKLDVAKCLKLRLQGNTYDEIGAIFSCTGSAVYQALTKFEPFINQLQPGQLTAYSENRADLFNAVEQHLTASLLCPDALAKASLNNRAYAFKQIHEARRLEVGQSTANLSVLGKFIQQAESQLGAPKAQAGTQARPRLETTQAETPTSTPVINSLDE